MTERDLRASERASEICKLSDDAAAGICRRYTPLIMTLSRRTGVNSTWLHDDLMQAGYIGLLRAADRYKEERHVQFMTYAVPWILGEMRRAMREYLDADKSHSARRRLTAAIAKYRQEHGCEARISDLAAETGIDAETAALLLERQEHGCISLDAMRIDTIEDIYCTDVQSHLELKDAIRRLNQSERSVIFHRYMQGRTQTETARILSKSQSFISKTEQRALMQLRAILQNDQNTMQAKNAQSSARSSANVISQHKGV